MTDQEKRQQRASLLIEIDEAQDELNHLREKAYRASDALEEVARKIQMIADVRPSRADFTADLELAHRLKPEHEIAINFNELGSLIEQLRTARRRLFNLAERKSQLSSNDYSISI